MPETPPPPDAAAATAGDRMGAWRVVLVLLTLALAVAALLVWAVERGRPVVLPEVGAIAPALRVLRTLSSRRPLAFRCHVAH